MGEQAKEKRVNSRALVLIALHVLLFFYSFSGFTSKFAAQQPTMSFGFFAWYGAMLAVLAVYALGWQQILKRLPLTVAFANKAVTVIWGIVWGVLLFHETVTLPMVIGGVIVIAGIVLFAIADGDERKAEAAREAVEKAPQPAVLGDGAGEPLRGVPSPAAQDDKVGDGQLPLRGSANRAGAAPSDVVMSQPAVPAVPSDGEGFTRRDEAGGRQ